MFTQEIIYENGMSVLTQTRESEVCKYKIGDDVTIPITNINERGNLNTEYYNTKIKSITMYEGAIGSGEYSYKKEINHLKSQLEEANKIWG